MQFPMGSVLREWFLVGDHWAGLLGFSYRNNAEGFTDELDCAVPRAGNEGILGDGAPAHRKGLPLVFVKIHDREVVDAQVEQLQRAVSASSNQLVLIDLRPGQVVQRIVRVESTSGAQNISRPLCRRDEGREREGEAAAAAAAVAYVFSTWTP